MLRCDALPSLQIEYTGGIWGYLTHIVMWLNIQDPAASDAVVFFSNLNPAIPAGADGACLVSAADNSAPISLQPYMCGAMDSGADMTTYVSNRLASMWNITGSYSSS
jgi:hypothetical protein